MSEKVLKKFRKTVEKIANKNYKSFFEDVKKAGIFTRLNFAFCIIFKFTPRFHSEINHK